MSTASSVIIIIICYALKRVLNISLYKSAIIIARNVIYNNIIDEFKIFSVQFFVVYLKKKKKITTPFFLSINKSCARRFYNVSSPGEPVCLLFAHIINLRAIFDELPFKRGKICCC